MLVELVQHGVTKQFPECTLEVEIKINRQQLHLDYHLTGCIDDILLPGRQESSLSLRPMKGENFHDKAIQSSPAQKDGLWEHTCFEAFLGIAGQDAYCEFNLSPSQAHILIPFISSMLETFFELTTYTFPIP